jgi:putative flavoprotein involved in K+ transport
MSRIPVVVIGAGQAGLAVSHLLSASDVDHVVLDRGGVAERWAAQSWESLRLLSPNWLSRLPGHRYTGPDPDGFMTAGAVAGYLRDYAERSAAPVVRAAEVLSVRACGDRYGVTSTAGFWSAAAVVIATGWCDLPAVPRHAAALDTRIAQLTPATYRDPYALPDGRVLVVGASATGSQLADELARAGREVVLAVGAHTRLPRRYRGRDVMWWLDAMGLFARRIDEGRRAAARDEPSMQLVGSADGRDVDLRSLQERGVRLVGRLTGVDGVRARFADDLGRTTAAADARLRGLLDRIDAYAAATGLAARSGSPEPLRAACPAAVADQSLADVRTVIWATGYRRAYPWLRVPILDGHGDIRHVDGTTPAPGMYVVGMRWQSRRGSSFLDGVRYDAATVAGRILDRLGARCQEVAP